ncbi:hypothetical protein FDECE_12861 [Fusarium decemcellulare]|nr:hypothetical protein FDECE_12861 [Fusarium decemcellulare]
MVRFSFTALAIMASATLIGALPVAPRQDASVNTGVDSAAEALTGGGQTSGDPYAPNAEPEPQPLPKAQPAPQPIPAADPQPIPAPQPLPVDDQTGGSGTQSGDPFSAGNGDGGAGTAESVADALTGV